jgi:hypothetical protein
VDARELKERSEEKGNRERNKKKAPEFSGAFRIIA